MATYFDIMQDANDPNVSNSELAVKYNPDAIFSEANGGAAARSCGHSMKVRAEKMIAEGRGDEQYVPIRQRGTNGNGGNGGTVNKPKAGKVVTALAIEDAKLRGLIVQAVSVAGYVYKYGAMNTERDVIRGHLENKTAALINAIMALAPLMGIDADKAISDLSDWSGVKTLAQRKIDGAVSMYGKVRGIVELARQNEQRRITLIKDGFDVYGPAHHYYALMIDDCKLNRLSELANDGNGAALAAALADLTKAPFYYGEAESDMDSQVETVIKTMHERDLIPSNDVLACPPNSYFYGMMYAKPAKAAKAAKAAIAA